MGRGLTPLAAFMTVLLKRKVSEALQLADVVLDVLYNAVRAIPEQVVHGSEGFLYTAPVLGLNLSFGPEVLHDDVVVLPIIGVVGEHLQLGD